MSETSGTHRLDMLRRRGWIVLICAVLVPVSAWIASRQLPREWTATAQLLFRDPGFDQKLFGSSFLAPSKDPSREAATNVKLVSLEAVFDRAARVLGNGETGGSLKQKVGVQSQGQSDVVAINATDRDPRAAARIANAVATQYVAFRRQADRSTILQALQPVDDQVRSLTSAELRGPQGRSLQDRAEQLRIFASLQTGSAELVQPAVVPKSPSSPKVARNVALGLLLGILLGLALAVLAERVDPRLRGTAEAETLLGRPILAEIPESRDLRGRANIAAALHGREVEAFRTLRVALRFLDVGREVRSVVITSAVPGEGKSTVALNLALTAAASGATTILLEADLRRPNLATGLGLASRSGLAGILLNDLTLTEATQEYAVGPETQGRSLDVIAAGGSPPNPAELLGSPRMSTLLEELAARYELVVFDTPPLTVVTDAVPLIRRSSGALIVVRAGQSTRPAVHDLRRRLDTLDIVPLGIVLNSAETGTGYYSGYYDQVAVGSASENGHLKPPAPSRA